MAVKRCLAHGLADLQVALDLEGQRLAFAVGALRQADQLGIGEFGDREAVEIEAARG